MDIFKMLNNIPFPSPLCCLTAISPIAALKDIPHCCSAKLEGNTKIISR